MLWSFVQFPSLLPRDPGCGRIGTSPGQEWWYPALALSRLLLRVVLLSLGLLSVFVQPPAFHSL